MKTKGITKLGGISAAAIAVLTFALTACSTSKPQGTGHLHSSDSEPDTVGVDHGKKWVVAEPMMAHLCKIESDVKRFQAENATSQDHTALATTIQENLGRLVTNCTMKGPAHDALHEWLLPFIAVSTDYSTASELGEQQKKFQEIEKALVAFNMHFE